MNTTTATVTTQSSQRRISLTAGILYLITFVSIPTVILYGPVKGAHYVIGSGPDTGAMFGGVLEIIVALAGIGTAVVLFPVLKKQNEGFALGLVASRTLEAATIFLGVAFLLTVVTMRRDGVAANALITSHTLVILYNRIFLLGQAGPDCDVAHDLFIALDDLDTLGRPHRDDPSPGSSVVLWISSRVHFSRP